MPSMYCSGCWDSIVRGNIPFLMKHILVEGDRKKVNQLINKIIADSHKCHKENNKG